MRQLKALLVADIHKFTAIVEAGEAEALEALVDLRDQVLEPRIKDHGGECLRRAGDGVLGAFDLAQDALAAADKILSDISARNGPFQLRIGLHLADVTREGDTIHGHGVNLAIRLEGIAPAGGIAASEGFAIACPGAGWVRIGRRQVKNISTPIDVYSLGDPANRLVRRRWLRRAVASLAGLVVATGLAVGMSDQLSVNASDTLEREAALPAGLVYPEIAFLPFKSLTQDSHDAAIADALSRDIAGEVMRHSNVSPQIGAPLSGHSLTAAEIDALHEHGARFAVTGTIMRTVTRIRLMLQVIDLETRRPIFARQVESSGDYFALEDAARREIVPAISALGDARGPLAEAAFAPGAFQELVAAEQAIFRHDLATALTAIASAQELAPDAARVEARRIMLGLIGGIMALRPATPAERAAAARAVAEAPFEPETKAVFALYQALDGRSGAASRALLQAMAKAPHNRDIHAIKALALLVAGNASSARRLLSDAPEFGPPARWQRAVAGLADILTGRAIDTSIMRDDTPLEAALIIASHARNGDLEEMEAAAARYRATYDTSPRDIVTVLNLGGDTSPLDDALSLAGF